MDIFNEVVKVMTTDLPEEDAPEKLILYNTMEVLPGRTASNNFLNLPEERKERLIFPENSGIDINELENCEPEPKLGNGGLGRLAACMVESCAAKCIPMEVNTIRFQYGLFRQTVDSGGQKEAPDKWLDENGHYPFELPHPEQAVEIQFNGALVKAVPYDIPVWGNGKRPYVNFIRMWAVDAVSCPPQYMPFFKKIDETLYPDDSAYEGKLLRIRQEYFLSACVIGDMLRKLENNGWSVGEIPEHFVLHMNDTHPVLMIPELMRVLRQKGLTFEQALTICEKTFVFTNHTILAEALEKWDAELIRTVAPQVYEQINAISAHYSGIIESKYPEDAHKKQELEIIRDGRVHMARLAIWVSRSTNGVAELHTEILRNRELKDFCELFPNRFHNVTNGVTQRKWIGHANPGLGSLLDAITFGKNWRYDFDYVKIAAIYADSIPVQREYRKQHAAAKRRLSEYIKKTRNIDIPSDFIFDVQVKRFHEYKRQQLNCLKIIALYQALKNDPSMKFEPTAFIFAGKAAASYAQAKSVIRLIIALEKLINNDPDVNGKLRVAFVEDYNVSTAELIIPAADISEQISTASKEASGTGNMKFMLNGAVTIGTLDGANVEMHKELHGKNIFIFGLSADEVLFYEAHPGSYAPAEELARNPMLKKAISALTNGTIRSVLPDENGDHCFHSLVNEWLYGQWGGPPDKFFVLKDFQSYYDTYRKLNRTFSVGTERMSLMNIASSAKFSSDRMVDDYCRLVWNIGEDL